MKRKTIYYDSLGGLIPVRIIGLAGDRVFAKVTRSRGPYRAGEVLNVPRETIVVVSRRTRNCVYVSPVETGELQGKGV